MQSFVYTIKKNTCNFVYRSGKEKKTKRARRK